MLFASYRPSVRLSVTRVVQSKWLTRRIVEFSPYSNAIPVVFVDKFYPEIRTVSLWAGRQTRVGRETSYFL